MAWIVKNHMEESPQCLWLPKKVSYEWYNQNLRIGILKYASQVWNMFDIYLYLSSNKKKG